MAQKHGALCQKLRALESHVRDKDQELLTIARLSATRSYFSTAASCMRQGRPPPLRLVSMSISRQLRPRRSRTYRMGCRNMSRSCRSMRLSS
jgi:hypothetical protein